MKIIVSGGGTGGHIYPALAIIEEIQKRDPEGEILYVGTKSGLEADIVPKAGIPFRSIEVRGLPRKLSLNLLKSGVALLKGLRQSTKILKEFKPDLVIGTGGFVSFPIVYQASRRNIPTMLHEQNSVAGIANRILGKYVDRIALTFEESQRFFKRKEICTRTGNPIRKDFFEEQKGAYETYGLSPKLPVVLVFGGSNGHAQLNETMKEVIRLYSDKDIQIIHTTGKNFYDAFVQDIGDIGENIKLYPYLYDIISAYGITDLLVTSAGAITLAEIAACGLPAILIPKSYTTENHQEYNARAVAEKGAAVLLLEKDLDGQELYETIENLIHDPVRLKEMSKASKALGTPDAAKEIVDILFALQKE